MSRLHAFQTPTPTPTTTAGRVDTAALQLQQPETHQDPNRRNLVMVGVTALLTVFRSGISRVTGLAGHAIEFGEVDPTQRITLWMAKHVSSVLAETLAEIERSLSGGVTFEEVYGLSIEAVQSALDQQVISTVLRRASLHNLTPDKVAEHLETKGISTKVVQDAINEHVSNFLSQRITDELVIE